MNAIRIVKSAVKLVVGVGTSAIVKQIIENNVEAETTIEKMTIPAASAAIGYAASDAVGNYTDSFIDEAAEFIKKIKNRSSEK